MKYITMMSTADKIKGQGVGSAYIEQVNLVKMGLSHKYKISINEKKGNGIIHYHSIDLKHYFNTFRRKNNIHLGYVHFLPETIKGSIKLPKPIEVIFYKYIIKFYKRMDYLVTVNPYFIQLLENYGINNKKIHYIPNYVTKENFYNMNKKKVQMLKTEYKIPTNKFVVLSVGQIQTRKGVLDFIELAKINPQMQFVWAGGFSFGHITDGYKALKKVVESPPENVQFLGIVPREQMNGIYNCADVLWMPSYNELFPMAILEAMSCEVPIVLRNLEIYDGILKSYCLKGRDNNCFNILLNSLANNPNFYKLTKNMALNGSKKYSEESVLKQWEALYDHLYESRFLSEIT